MAGKVYKIDKWVGWVDDENIVHIYHRINYGAGRLSIPLKIFKELSEKINKSGD